MHDELCVLDTCLFSSEEPVSALALLASKEFVLCIMIALHLFPLQPPIGRHY
jgi:hypothetical protein